jgi:hypothetical protein
VVEARRSSRIVSVFGGNRRRNRWLLAADTSVLNVFGRSHLDLREVEACSSEVEMTVHVAFGSVSILVPEGSNVSLSGTSILASSDCLVQGSAPSHLPPLMITATTVLGRTRVVSVPAGTDVGPHRRRRRRAPVTAAVTPAADGRVAMVGEASDLGAAGRGDDAALPAPTMLDVPFDPAAFAAAARGE